MMKIVKFRQNRALEMGHLKYTYVMPEGREYLVFEGTLERIREDA